MSIITIEVIEVRPSNVGKRELIDRLKKQFNNNEPIFTDEIIAAWSEYSRPRVFQLLKELCEEGLITRDSLGVYYFSEPTPWGTQSALSTTKVAEKKYMKANGKVFGYYAGWTLYNLVGLSNQVPNTLEIVTVNESTRVREVYINERRFILRRAKMEITEANASIMQLLEIFNWWLDRPLEKYQSENLLALLGRDRVDKRLVVECAKHFPKRALQNFMKSEIGYVIA